MELIPLIHIKNSKLYLEKTQSSVTLEEFLKQVDEEMKIYILDLDGIENDKPNLHVYQKLSSSNDLWVDNGPRNLGDIVDTTMAGATSITLRRNFCPQLNISDIKEISENKVYENFDLDNDFPFYDSDGFVNFNSREKIETNIEYNEIFKKMISTNKIYSYEIDIKNRFYWEHLGVEGLLIDTNKLKEFMNALRK
jgi:hypothetical protein